MFDFDTPITKDTYLVGQWDCSTYDPDNPTLEGLKAAVDAGDYGAFPVGTEIPDTYAGNSNPLIVAQYLNSSNNSSYGGAEGAICIRKYVDPTNVTFGDTTNYEASRIRNYLNTDYLAACSDALKNVLSDLPFEYIYSNGKQLLTDKWFLMSATEVCAVIEDSEGVSWKYFIDKTGLTTPNNAANNGRIQRSSDGAAQVCWLRTWYSSSNQPIQLAANGYVGTYGAPTHNASVLPACFISKN